jgi:hypothetical protein
MASLPSNLQPRMIIKKHRLERLDVEAKLHFKTTQAVLAGLS